MKKGAILFLCLFLTISPAFAQKEIKFKDVPDTHWAAKSVYDLVRLGVTQGYPDGTFRGEKYITRYETAMFLSKLATAIGTDAGVDVSALKSDIKALKTEISALRRQPIPTPIPITGSYSSRLRVGNVITSGSSQTIPPKGPRVDYRLMTTLSKDLGDGANVKVNLDTMDSGFNGGGEEVATRLLDLEGNFKFDIGLQSPVSLKVTAGPGPQIHYEYTNTPLTSESGIVYIRPRNSISLSTTISGIELGGGYTARILTGSGEVKVNQFSGSIGFTFVDVPLLGLVKLIGAGDYLLEEPFAQNPGAIDSRGKIIFSARPSSKVQGGLTIGIAKFENSPHGLYYGLEISLIDPLETGTFFTLRGHKIGSEYLYDQLLYAEWDMIGYDNFSRPLTNGSADINGEIIQTLTEKLTLRGKWDIRLTEDFEYGEQKPGSQAMFEIGITHDIAPSTTLDFNYRVQQVPTNLTDKTTDIVTLGFMYKF